jgi:hypothetical protein
MRSLTQILLSLVLVFYLNTNVAVFASVTHFLPSVDLANQEPKEILIPGDVVIIGGDFPMTLTQVRDRGVFRLFHACKDSIFYQHAHAGAFAK